ncbi:MAG: ABC transporter ATP-binding protein [Chitinophagaceae bacterium]|nr:ABC transporter ATP-binding protein [Chitinophagaceae bacterium]
MNPILEYQHVWIRYRDNYGGIHSVKDWVTSLRNPFHTKVILEDISFKLMPGESLGILGRNGCGKSTLLRSIGGIIKPAKGKIICSASIAPILALGAGLEMELTGFENIRLLLSLYGVRPTAERIRSIQLFSELDDVTLNHTVKCYSSGMLARLAFSISFHHDCDIYIIDEVLAVGDLGFQAKCTERIRQLKDTGKSIIFVSHFPDEVQQICEQAILLEQGKIINQGKSSVICQQYKEIF